MPQGFIVYNMAHGILTMTKHVEQEYAFLLMRSLKRNIMLVLKVFLIGN
jgi:hypothetical protein